MSVACPNRQDVGTKVDCRECCSHLSRVVANFVCRIVSQLTATAIAETLHREVVEKHTGVRAARRRGPHPARSAECDRGQGIAQFVRRITTTIGCSRSQPTIATTAEALHRQVIEHHTRVRRTESQRHSCAARAQTHRGGGDEARSCAYRRVGAPPQLSRRVEPPARHLSGVEQGTRVVVTCRDRDGCGTAERDCGQSATHLATLIASIQVVTYTELSEDVAAPALHGRIIEKCARVFFAQGELCRGTTRSKIDSLKTRGHLPSTVAE